MHQFILMLGQDSFYSCIKVVMPYQALVTYNVTNNEIEIVDITLPFKPMEYFNMTAIQQQAKDAANNNAIEMGHIGSELLVTVYEIIKQNP